MIWICSFLIAGCAVGLIASTRTRAAELERLARGLGCPFQARKETVTTPMTAGHLDFFTRFFHQYANVFTFTDKACFIRLFDDKIFTDDNPRTKPFPFTVCTAELKRGDFPLLKIWPADSPLSSTTPTLEQTQIFKLDNNYHLQAKAPQPDLSRFPILQSLLKKDTQVYLELNENAFVYHEHRLIPVAEMEIFRFRALQILGELEKYVEENTPRPDTQLKKDDPFAPDERAAALLARFAEAGLPQKKHAPMWRGFWFLLLMVIFGGITVLSWFALNNWLGQ